MGITVITDIHAKTPIIGRKKNVSALYVKLALDVAMS